MRLRGVALLAVLGLLFAIGATPADAAAKRRCRKGMVRKGRRCVKKRAVTVTTARAATTTTQAAAGGTTPTTAAGPFKITDPGIDSNSIKLGQTIAYSGPLSAYGTIGKTEAAYFKFLNSKGGVKMGDGVTRKIEFISYDDGYSPPKSVENAKRLVEEDKVFGLFNPLGTPVNLAIWDYTNSKKVPQFLVATGASFWGRKIADHPFVTGWQPAYTTESSIYAQFLKDTKPNAKVAVLYQNDDYGKDYYKQFEQSIAGSNIKFVAEQSYEPTDPTVDQQVTVLARSSADTFFNISTPKFAAQAIKKAAELNWKPLHILNGVSASVESVLKPAGFQNSQGIISLTYAKDPSDPQWANDAGMKEYLAWAAANAPDLDPKNAFVAYGFNVSQALEKVLGATTEPSRLGLMRALRSMDFTLPMLLPGIKAKMDGAKDTYPLESMQLIKFTDDRFVLQGNVISYEGRTPKD